MSEETNNNRDTLISMMAISEDITRTNSRIYELLRQLMNNPQELTNIKTSIDNLHEKVTNLKNSDLGIPLVEEEKVMVPGPDNISPKDDVEYGRLSQKEMNKVDSEVEEKLNDNNAEELTPESELETEELMPEPVTEIPSRNTQRSQKNAAKQRPNRPLNNRKKSPQTQ